MTQILSQEEIDQLLRAINAGDTGEEDLRPAADTRKFKIYNFKRPDKFSKEQIRTISILHDTFAHLSTTYLSSYLFLDLNSTVHVHVASVDQITYEEFIRSIPTPTTLAVVNMNPLEGNALLEIDPEITFSLIDKLLGGRGGGTKYRQGLTDIETEIMEDIAAGLLDNLRESWSNVIDLCPRLKQIDTNPQFVQIVPPTEMVALITFEVKINNIEGMLNFCIPYDTIKPVINRLSAQFWYGNANSGAQEEKNKTPKIDIQNIPINMIAELFNRTCTVGEISKWEKNKTVVYPHEKKDSKKCVVKIDEYSVFNAVIENVSDIYHRKIRITEILKPYKERTMTDAVDVTTRAKLDNSGGVASILNDVKMDISVELGRTRRPVKDILAMGEGTVIELNAPAGEPVNIFVNGKIIAKGEVVVIDENFGVRITELLANSQDS